MFQQVDIVNQHGEELSLQLGDVSTGIILADIQGLDPVKAILSSSDFAMRDGTQFQSARRGPRDIIIQMNLDSRFGGVPVSVLRRNLYSVLMPKEHIEMTFLQSDMPAVVINGVIEDVVSPRFTEKPTYGVAIHCNDPDFIDPVVKFQTGEGFSQAMNLVPVMYDGTVDSGIEFLIDVDGTGVNTGFVLRQVTPNGKTRNLTFSTPLQTNDQIRINTHPGVKEAVLIRGGLEDRILHAIDPFSQWPILEEGINQIGVQVTGGTFQSYYEYTYLNRYGAI